jgi:hypothetical protein
MFKNNGDVDIDKMAREFNNNRKQNKKLKEEILSGDIVKPYNSGIYSLQGEYSLIGNEQHTESEFNDTISLNSFNSNSSNQSTISVPQQIKNTIHSKHLTDITDDDAILLHIKHCKKCQNLVSRLNNHDFDYKQILIIILICVFVVLLIDFFRRK